MIKLTYKVIPSGRLRVTETVTVDWISESTTWLGKRALAELASRGIKEVTVDSKRFLTNNK